MRRRRVAGRFYIFIAILLLAIFLVVRPHLNLGGGEDVIFVWNSAFEQSMDCVFIRDERVEASEAVVRRLADNGQIATQYVDLAGVPTMDTAFAPNGSACAVEGITSPDGRVLGKMGHSERIGKNLYRNIPDRYDMKLFDSAVRYFKKI